MSNNTRFLSAYNRLDDYLRSLVRTRGTVNMISYLERILPEKKAAECQTIRKYKNVVESHGVNPGDQKPIVPEVWITWLLDELEWCKRHRDIIAPKLQKALNERNGSRKGYVKGSEPKRAIDSFNERMRGDLVGRSPRAFVIYITKSNGSSGYFAGFSQTLFRKQIILVPSPDAPQAQKFPTSSAAVHVENEINNKFPDAYTSVLAVN